jgi:hypothetical protein
MLMTVLLVTIVTVLFVGILLYLVYRETEIDLPPRHCTYHRHATRHA